jgi:hypothetical protein
VLTVYRRFSGVAWAYSREHEKIQVISSWDSMHSFNRNVEKAPTQLFYGKVGNSAKWGHAIAPHETALRWFKLLLLDDEDIPEEVSESTNFQEALELQKLSGKSPTKIITYGIYGTTLFRKSRWLSGRNLFDSANFV